MPIVLFEIPDSRAITENPPSVTLRMKSTGEVDEWTALNEFYFSTPVSYLHPGAGLLWRQNISLVPDGFAQFIATIPYGPKRRDGSASFSFDTSGATINVKCGRSHVNDYATDGNNVNPYGGAINATPDGVEGADIIIPALRLVYQFTHPKGVVTEAHARTLASATGCTNSDTFRGFAAGELLCAGASGSDGTDTDATVSYNLIASQNVTGLQISDITGIAKKGHDFLWIEFKPVEASGQAARKPRRVHIERVYGSINFASTFGWS